LLYFVLVLENFVLKEFCQRSLEEAICNVTCGLPNIEHWCQLVNISLVIAELLYRKL
jgi:hypothetical protein